MRYGWIELSMEGKLVNRRYGIPIAQILGLENVILQGRNLQSA